MVKGPSEVFDLYDQALKQTKGRLESRYEEANQALDEFYDEFLHNHVLNYGAVFEDPEACRQIHDRLRQRYHEDRLRFWAVDGACMKLPASDLVIFYGGAYAIKGELHLSKHPPTIEYSAGAPADDTSLVAYLPLSPEDLIALDPENRFVVSDEDRINTSGMDTDLMLLGEIYLCYQGARQSHGPHLILWDHSISSILANATPNIDDLHLAGLRIAGHTIYFPDVLIAYSRPWKLEQGVPSLKGHRLWERAIAEMADSPDHSINLNDFADRVGLSRSRINTQLGLLWRRNKYGTEERDGPGNIIENADGSLAILEGDTLTMRAEYAEHLDRGLAIFESFCRRLFNKKDPAVLLYEFEDQSGRRTRYLGQPELKFLMAIGLRLTMEACWENDVMLVGMAKDSASRYFTQYYLGVLSSKDIKNFDPPFSFEFRRIPGTDRLVFEGAPSREADLKAPWASTEFDAVFMTLRMRRPPEQGKRPYITGMRGDILLSPNLVMRSLCQFFLRRYPRSEDLMGHVVFVDRLVHPGESLPRMTIVKGHTDLGTVAPFVVENGSVANPEQEIIMYLLNQLTRNVFPEIIGYPDPLHLADRGAKSVLRMVEPMLRSSERQQAARPLYHTLRQSRDT